MVNTKKLYEYMKHIILTIYVWSPLMNKYVLTRLDMGGGATGDTSVAVGGATNDSMSSRRSYE